MSKVEPARCPWPVDELYRAYHDTEWGVPLHDDRKLFEFLVLEGAQAGLSWHLILKKRENYRAAFDQFDPAKVARYSAAKIARLLADPGIVRNRLKIAAAVNNAKCFLAVQEEFGSFDRYIWRFVEGRTKVNQWRSTKEVPARTPESDAMSRDLRQRGFKFVGSTICYAHMQATGMVNDHLISCFRHKSIRRRLKAKMKDKDPKPRTKAFALRVIRKYSKLPKNDTIAQVLGRQVLRSGTSVGANYRQASRGRSKAEFTSKIGDCLKEIEETGYWLELLVDSGCVPAANMADLLDETRQLIAIFTTIDKNAKG